MEDPKDAHDARTAVLDAVDLLRREMKARTRADRRRFPPDVGDALALDDVADLVV